MELFKTSVLKLACYSKKGIVLDKKEQKKSSPIGELFFVGNNSLVVQDNFLGNNCSVKVHFNVVHSVGISLKVH